MSPLSAAVNTTRICSAVRAARRIRAAHRRQQAARDRALKLLAVEEFDARTRAWVDRFEAAARHGERLDALGASAAARRGVRSGGHDVDKAPATTPAPAETDQPAPAPEEELQPVPASQDSTLVSVIQSAVPAPDVAAQQIARDEQATVILELHREGLSERAIAERTPWSRSTVNRVLKKHGARRSDAQAPSLLDVVQA